MSSLVLGFQEMDEKQLLLVGGKGVNLGELSKIQEFTYQKAFVLQQQGFKKPSNETKRFKRCWLNWLC